MAYTRWSLWYICLLISVFHRLRTWSKCEFLCHISFLLQAKITPLIGSSAFGALGVNLLLFKAELRLTAYVLTTSFPTRADVYFSKFPLDVKYVSSKLLLINNYTCKQVLKGHALFIRCSHSILELVRMKKYSRIAKIGLSLVAN